MTDALWYLSRGTGVVALLLITVSLVLGIATRSGHRFLGLSRFVVSDLHRTTSLAGVALVAVHVGTLLLDPYAQLRLVDVLLPFAGSIRPIWQGLGTLAVDALVVLVGSSLLRHRLGPRLFRALHWTSYALWPLALAHSLGDGGDGASLWFRCTAVACCLAVLAAVPWRVSQGSRARGTVPARPRARVLP